MADEETLSGVRNLVTEQGALLERARDARARRAAITVYGGRDAVLRQTMIALLAGSELAEHESPPEATLHVLAGHISLIVAAREIELATGDHIEIPHERHAVTAEADSVFLLTAIREA